jgi:hypothetical protein
MVEKTPISNLDVLIPERPQLVYVDHKQCGDRGKPSLNPMVLLIKYDISCVVSRRPRTESYKCKNNVTAKSILTIIAILFIGLIPIVD